MCDFQSKHNKYGGGKKSKLKSKKNEIDEGADVS